MDAIDPFGLVRWTGTVYSWVVGRAFVSGVLFIFTLTSECVGGKQAIARVRARGFGGGFGLPVTNTGSSVSLRDSLSHVHPEVFNGGFSAVLTGASFPIGYGWSKFTLGGASSDFGGGVEMGFDGGFVGLTGDAKVLWSRVWDCGCTQ